MGSSQTVLPAESGWRYFFFLCCSAACLLCIRLAFLAQLVLELERLMTIDVYRYWPGPIEYNFEHLLFSILTPFLNSICFS